MASSRTTINVGAARLPSPPKALLIKNYPSSSPVDHLMVQSFRDNIRRFAEDAVLDICCVANGEPIPDDLTQYRLIVLSGGKVDLIAADQSEIPSWAHDVLDRVRRIAAMDGSQAPPKLLGICWGHQAIHHALGGKLAWVEQGPLVGVQTVKITTEGQKWFGQESLRMQKYHVRYVQTTAPGFCALADRNDISISDSRRILTFQGHPELTAEISYGLSGRDDGTYASKAAAEASDKEIFIEDASAPHDGQRVWKYIMEWALA